MRKSLFVPALALAVAASGAAAQNAPDSAKTKEYRSSRFWESTLPFEMTLVLNLKQIQADDTDPGPWRAATVSYVDDTPRSHAARVRTRGRSRLRICDRFPPLWVDFRKEDVKGSELQRLNRFKLVSPCKYGPDYDRYVIGEFNVYRIHQLFTPVSHRTRLVKLTVKDSASGKEHFTKYAFAVEEMDDLAERVGGHAMKLSGMTVTDLEPRQTAVMGMLQYMIGNTDFSFSAPHNVEFVTKAGAIYPINFDYDQAGIINAVYSLPDASLGIRRVTERVYRGLCVPPDTVKVVIAEMKARRPQVEALYRDSLAKLMGGATTSTALRFINGFFSDMDNPRIVQRDILEKCAVAR